MCKIFAKLSFFGSLMIEDKTETVDSLICMMHERMFFLYNGLL